MKKENKETQGVWIVKSNETEFKGKTGVLTIVYNNKVLKQFVTENCYALYKTLRSLSKRDTGTYSRLPQNFKAMFLEKPID